MYFDEDLLNSRVCCKQSFARRRAEEGDGATRQLSIGRIVHPMKRERDLARSDDAYNLARAIEGGCR